MASANRYSREQILCGLRWIIRSDCAAPPDEGESIYAHIERTDFLADVGFDFFRIDCEQVFGTTIDKGEWEEFFGLPLCRSNGEEWLRTFAPQVTYERLADWLADRIPAVSFAAVDIAGARCERAGAFLGLRDLVRQLDPNASRFAPSTPIRTHLSRSGLFALWSRLTWLSADNLPALRNRWVFRAQVFVFLSALGAIGALVAAVAWGIAALAIQVLSFLKLSWAVLKLAERLENPLPDGIVTFGDLAKKLAEWQKAPTASA